MLRNIVSGMACLLYHLFPIDDASVAVVVNTLVEYHRNQNWDCSKVDRVIQDTCWVNSRSEIRFRVFQRLILRACFEQIGRDEVGTFLEMKHKI